MTEVGAGLMGSHSCFKADGSFNPSLYCIQELWAAAGGSPNGRIYPKTDAQAAALALNDPTTQQPSLDVTVAAFNNGVNIAMYGVDSNGAVQEFETIKANALDFLGVVMNNPCDGPTVQTGPHTPECLDYLWRTSGNPGQDTATADPSKLPYAYCKPDGLAAPLNKDGTVNQSNVTTVNGYGAIPNIRAYFQGIFNRTQDSSDFDSQAAAMRDCYNVNLTPPPEDPAACPPPNPDDWQCFGPTKLAQPEVFQPAIGYSSTQADAPAVCATYGAQVATLAQLQTAQQQGADWCSAGWVADDPTPHWPTNTSTQPGCGIGSPAVVAWMPPNNLASVNCFGKKPAPSSSASIMPFNTTSWNNPNALPPGISDSLVVLGRETANTVECATSTTNNPGGCMLFDSEGECASFLANKTPVTGSLVINDQVWARMQGDIDQYVRARV